MHEEKKLINAVKSMTQLASYKAKWKFSETLGGEGVHGVPVWVVFETWAY